MSAKPAMKVVHVITGLGVGGAESMLFKLLAQQADADIENTVVVMRSGGSIQAQLVALGIRVHALDIDSVPSAALAIFRLRNILRVIRPDVIQGWMYHGNYLALAGRFLTWQRPKVVWNIRHSAGDLALEKPLTAFLIRRGAGVSKFVDKVIYNSYAGRTTHQALGYRLSRSVVIENGFDPERFKPDAAQRKLFRAEHHIEPDVFVIGLVARPHRIKGHDILIDAAKIICAITTEVRFVLIGADINHPAGEISKQVANHGMAHQFLLLAERPDVENIYPAMDLFVSASRSEGFSNVVAEALLCGVPCVVTDVGDSGALARGHGEVVPPEDPKALAAACLSMMAKAVTERNAIGNRARDWITRQYSLDGISARYLELYESLRLGTATAASAHGASSDKS